ncbi:MAG: hypothetical protein KAR79_06290, partial [Simkaniaceae bacterium]|nr:hypothetical protein [Simkaniaceae bacterium]
NPLAMRKKFETIEKKMQKMEKPETAKQEAPKKVDTSRIENAAKGYQTRNPELLPRTLLILKSLVKENDDAATILKKVLSVYKDQALADEAIDFLIDTASTKKELIKAKKDFNAQFGREIRAGKNIGVEARAFSTKGLGSPTALRDLYRDITGNPRDPHDLFDELTEQFNQSDMKNVIDFILHSLGADLKAKGPSISRPELERLFSEGRIMQAFLGIFRFFQQRMRMIKKQFEKDGLTLPTRINNELLAKQLMKILKERYPTPDKILQLAFILGISEELAAQIIIFSQYRDALRNVSPRLFKSDRHRQDLLMTFIETLSDLDDMIDEEEEEQNNEPIDTME